MTGQPAPARPARVARDFRNESCYNQPMTARSFASGMVSFGLVNIPVKLYSTGEPAAGVQLNFLHKQCGSRLKQQYICPTDDVVVGREDMVKGYEYAKGQYVLFSEEEQKALLREATNTVAITEFVPLSQVDPIYFEKSYYLGPDKGGDRPYRLLAEAMVRTGQAALARYAARGKDYLVLVRPFEGGLIMQQLRYVDEIRPFEEVPIAPAELREGELQLAMQLIEQIASDRFEPDKYEDEVRQQAREMIDRKIQGQEITAAPVEAPRTQVVDLMAALKASLGQPAAAPRALSGAAARLPAQSAPRSAQRSTRPAAGSRAGAGSAGSGGPARPSETKRAQRSSEAKSVTAAAGAARRPAALLKTAKPTASALATLESRKPPKPAPRKKAAASAEVSRPRTRKS
jgi:DNA end-binding protein Ku